MAIIIKDMAIIIKDMANFFAFIFLKILFINVNHFALIPIIFLSVKRKKNYSKLPTLHLYKHCVFWAEPQYAQ